MPAKAVVPDHQNHPFIRKGVFHATGIDPITKSEGLKAWMLEHDLNPRKAAALLKKSSATVENYLKLLELAPELQEKIRSGEVKMYSALNATVAKDAPAPEPQPVAPPPPPPIEPAPLPPAALATIPEPAPAPLARADEVEALYRMVQSLKGEIAMLVDNLVETPPAPVAPLVQPAAPTSIVINITVQTGGAVTIQQ